MNFVYQHIQQMARWWVIVILFILSLICRAGFEMRHWAMKTEVVRTHGQVNDKDLLVPIEHSQKMLAALKEKKATVELLTIEGAAHGFNTEQNLKVIPAMVGWFQKHLAKKETGK